MREPHPNTIKPPASASGNISQPLVPLSVVTQVPCCTITEVASTENVFENTKKLTKRQISLLGKNMSPSPVCGNVRQGSSPSFVVSQTPFDSSTKARTPAGGNCRQNLSPFPVGSQVLASSATQGISVAAGNIRQELCLLPVQSQGPPASTIAALPLLFGNEGQEACTVSTVENALPAINGNMSQKLLSLPAERIPQLASSTTISSLAPGNAAPDSSPRVTTVFVLVKCTGTPPPLPLKRPIPRLSRTSAVPPAPKDQKEGPSPLLVNSHPPPPTATKTACPQPANRKEMPRLLPVKGRKQPMPTTNIKTSLQLNVDHAGGTLSGPSSKSRLRPKRQCPYCPFMLSVDRSCIVKHIRRKHPAKAIPYRAGTSPCMECNFKALSLKDLIRHYNIIHGKSMKINTATFSCKEDFETFKSEAERQTMTEFVKQRGRRKNSLYVKESFYCCRSGEAKLIRESDRKRAKRSHGTKKMSGKCTCFITVKHYIETKKAIAEFCLDHVGHEKIREMEDEEMAHRRRMTYIRNRHRSAVAKNFKLEHKHEGEWIVHPSDEMRPKQYYHIKKTLADHCQCKESCAACGVCSHKFTCTCFDNVAQGLPCKHIHAVQLSLAAASAMEDVPPTSSQEVLGGAGTDFFEQYISEGDNSFQDLRSAILHKINDLIDVVNSADSEHILSSIMSTVTSAVTFAKGLEITDKHESTVEVTEQLIADKAKHREDVAQQTETVKHI